MKIIKKLISGTVAAVLFLCSVPAQSIVTAADAAEPIGVIELNNIFTHLSYGAAPSFTTYLSADSALQMSIRDEAWAVIGSDDGVYRNAGDTVPYPGMNDEAYYSYYVLLQADSGYAFTDTFTLYYNGEQVSMMDYDYTLYASGDRLMIRCDFIGTVCPDHSADTVTEISTVSLNNISTELRCGEAPAFTAYLSPDSAGQMTLANEAWAVIGEDDGILRSTGDVMPYPENGEPVYYSYYVQLKANEGYIFTDEFSLFYNGEPVSMMDYDAELYESKDVLVIRCDFLGMFTPASGPAVIDAIYLENVSFGFTDGDAPVFSAAPADHSAFRLITEGWRGEGEAVFSKSGYNTEEYLGSASLLTAFRSGRNYTYFVRLECADGYMFDYTGGFRLYLNGVEYPYHLNVMQSGIELQIADLLTVPAAATAKPVTTTAKPVTTTEKPVTTTEKPVTTTAKPVTTTAKPVTTTAKTTTTEANGTAPEIPGLLLGDLNQDGRISVGDAVLLIRLLTEDPLQNMNSSGIAAADLDRDRMVTLADFRQLMRIISDAPKEEKPAAAGKMLFADEDAAMPAVTKKTGTSGSGKSDPFRISPLPGLTVSAEKNALHYDGQLSFSMFREDDLEKINEIRENFGLEVVAGWHADAGLAPDEYLPGNYHSEFDLKTLDYIPEELYDSVTVVRYDEDGGMKIFDVRHEGSVISWDSPQNSLIFICTFVIGLTTMIGGYAMSCGAIAYIGALTAIGSTVAWVDYKVMTPENAWAKDETKHLVHYEKDGFYIWYSDPDAKARLTRIRKAEEQAGQKAKAEIEKQYQQDREDFGLIGIGGLSGEGKLQIEKNVDTAALQKQYLDADKQYQADIQARDDAPADIVLLYESLRDARSYLITEQGMPEVGFEMNVLYCYGLTEDGLTETPKALWRNPYLVLKRRTDAVSSSASQQSLELSCVHEMYHLYQARYLNSNNEMNLKFMEMSAVIIEHQYAKYKGYSDDDENSRRIETYSIGIDDQKYGNMEARRSEGYTLSRFFEFLDEAAGGDPAKGIDIVRGYQDAGYHLTNFLCRFFNIGQAELAVCWDYYLQYINSDLWARYRQIGNYKNSSDDNDVFPSCMKKHPLNKDNMKKHFDVKVTPFSCKGIYCNSKDDTAIGLFMVPDEGLEESLPMFSILPLNEKAKTVRSEWVDTSKGTGILVRSYHEFIYAERQGINGVGASGYTLYFIPQPKTPKVDFIQDEENLLGDYYEVRLQSKYSTAGEDGITEHFLIRIYSGDEVLLEQLAEFEEWDKTQIIYPDQIKKPTDPKTAPTITVCEYFRDEATGAEYYGPESVKVPLENEFPDLDVEGKSGSCTYGAGTDKSVFIAGGASDCRFSLRKDGSFTFTYPEHAAEWDNLESKNPFIDPSAGHYTGSGFTVSGRVQNVPDVNNWTADIVSCTPNSFHAERYEERIPLHIEEVTHVNAPENAPPVSTVQDTDNRVYIDKKWSGGELQSGSTFSLKTGKDGTLHVSVCIKTASGDVVTETDFAAPLPPE